MAQRWAPGLDGPSRDARDNYFDIRPQDAVIGIMGMTGSGKSTFINYFSDLRRAKVSRKNKSCTHQVDLFRCTDPELGTFYLVDTPGFDDTTRTDTDILMEVTDWLNRAYMADILLTGIIYLHRITDDRMGGRSIKNLHAFQKLCGDDAFRKVVLATTFWDQVESEEIGESRERELMDKEEFWGRMVYRGSRIFRQDDKARSAKAIIRYLLSQRKPGERLRPLAIQTEMVDQRRTLSQTGAGAEIMTQLEKQKIEYEKKLQSLRKEMKDALESRDRDLQHAIQQLTWEFEEKKRREEQDRAKLQADKDTLMHLLAEQRAREDADREREEKEQEKREKQLRFELDTMDQQKNMTFDEKKELELQIEKEKAKAALLRWRIEQAKALQSRFLCTVM